MSTIMEQKASVELKDNLEAQVSSSDDVLVGTGGQIKRLPVPSNDPNDPLNFTYWEKMGIIVSCCWFSVMSLSVVGGLGAILEIFIKMYTPQGHSTNEVVWLSTFPSLFVGIGNYLILPLGLVYGRRLGTIISIFVLLGATVGCALSQTWEQHFALRIIQGLASGATESLLPLMLAEVLSGEEAQAYLGSEGEHDQDTIPEELWPKRTYAQMLKPWSCPTQSPIKTVLMAWFHMFEAFSSPGILYATLLSSVVLGSSVGLSLTYNTVLEYNYGWEARNIGLINLGGVFGGFGGMLYAGVFGDWFVLRMAKRANGIHTPEHRLLLLILPGILTVASLLVYGFTANGNATWGGPYMGWTLLQIAFVSVLILSTSFAAEAWERNPGPALVAVVGTKNIIAFALSYGINPMVEKYSYPTAMGVLAAVTGGVFLLGIPVYLLNPAWRRYIRRRELKVT
ncbi:hypothetical protein MW887_005637 [Aspergillus wentii]|nr:hypothetical protein MW887_005637 [Aspergillus wentii]